MNRTVVKQEMARVNVDILGISELKWTGMGEFNSDDHYILEKEMATQSSILAWKIPWMEEPSWSTKESKLQYLDAISKTTE